MGGKNAESVYCFIYRSRDNTSKRINSIKRPKISLIEGKPKVSRFVTKPTWKLKVAQAFKEKTKPKECSKKLRASRVVKGKKRRSER